MTRSASLSCMVLSFRSIRIDRQERVLQHLRHVGDLGLLHELPQLRLRTFAPGERRRKHQLANELRMPDGDL